MFFLFGEGGGASFIANNLFSCGGIRWFFQTTWRDDVLPCADKIHGGIRHPTAPRRRLNMCLCLSGFCPKKVWGELGQLSGRVPQACRLLVIAPGLCFPTCKLLDLLGEHESSPTSSCKGALCEGFCTCAPPPFACPSCLGGIIWGRRFSARAFIFPV